MRCQVGSAVWVAPLVQALWGSISDPLVYISPPPPFRPTPLLNPHWGLGHLLGRVGGLALPSGLL